MTCQSLLETNHRNNDSQEDGAGRRRLDASHVWCRSMRANLSVGRRGACIAVIEATGGNYAVASFAASQDDKHQIASVQEANHAAGVAGRDEAISEVTGQIKDHLKDHSPLRKHSSHNDTDNAKNALTQGRTKSGQDAVRIFFY
jgi:hypothetical protein